MSSFTLGSINGQANTIYRPRRGQFSSSSVRTSGIVCTDARTHARTPHSALARPSRTAGSFEFQAWNILLKINLTCRCKHMGGNIQCYGHWVGGSYRTYLTNGKLNILKVLDDRLKWSAFTDSTAEESRTYNWWPLRHITTCYKMSENAASHQWNFKRSC